MIWDVRSVRVQPGVQEDLEELDAALREGWEPFSAGPTTSGHVFYLRRTVYNPPKSFPPASSEFKGKYCQCGDFAGPNGTCNWGGSGCYNCPA